MLDQMVFSRRAVAKTLHVAALGTGSLLAVAAVSAAPAEERQIEAATARYHATKGAFAETLLALEQALPKLHPSLDMTKRRSGAFQYEGERRFNGERAERAVDSRGRPTQRLIATLDTIRLDLDRYSENRLVRRHLYRMRRRLKARLAQIDTLEKSFGIWDRHFDAVTAERELHELAKRLFEQPATTIAAVVVQAKALSAFAAIEGDGGYVRYESSRFGLILADGLQQVARAA